MHYIPVKRDIKTGISSLYLLLCDFFFFSSPSPQQIRKREFRLYICFFAASFYCFSFSFAMRPSSTVVIRQCSANCSCQALNCIWRQWWSNRRATEQMELGEGQQGRMKNTPIHVLFIRGSQIDTFGWRTQQNCVQTQRDGVHTP